MSRFSHIKPNQQLLHNDRLNASMLIYNRQSTARTGEGKHLPLLIQVLPAGRVYAETAALKQQKRPTKIKQKQKPNMNKQL